jgi:hypothetical protein
MPGSTQGAGVGLKQAIRSGGTNIPRYVELSDGSVHEVARFSPLVSEGEVGLANGNTADLSLVRRVLDENKNPIHTVAPEAPGGVPVAGSNAEGGRASAPDIDTELEAVRAANPGLRFGRGNRIWDGEKFVPGGISHIPETPAEPYSPEAAAQRSASQQPKPSKIGQSIEAKAVEAKLTQGFAETAGYDPITIKDQAERATSVIQNSVPNARAIVRGEAPLPEGLRGTSLITAMEDHLLRNPDPQLAYELANSPLTSATSAAAQEMRLMAERVPDSLSAKFAEIKKAREAGAKQRGETPAKIKAEINGEVMKAASKRPTWEQFVREIVC